MFINWFYLSILIRLKPVTLCICSRHICWMSEITLPVWVIELNQNQNRSRIECYLKDINTNNFDICQSLHGIIALLYTFFIWPELDFLFTWNWPCLTHSLVVYSSSFTCCGLNKNISKNRHYQKVNDALNIEWHRIIWIRGDHRNLFH